MTQPGITDSSFSLPMTPRRFIRRWGWFELAFFAVVVAALALRLFELSGRTMHYDEAIHLHFSFKLANSPGSVFGWPWIFGTDYLHSAWMHGPFQIEMAAAIFTILGDSDFTSRLGYALFGTALVGLPYLLRDHIGRHGALIAAVMLAVSPALLYFSRFGRNDIIMMFWAVSLFILMWRYLHGGRRVNLYLASAVLAFAFATKETTYLLVAIFGFIVFVGALPELLGWIRGRAPLVREGTQTALLLLLVTLTLPQWSAIIGLFQDLLGLTLANPDALTGNNVLNSDGSKGLTGAPAWQGSTLLLPVVAVPWLAHIAAVIAGLAVLVWMLSRGPLNRERASAWIALPFLSVFATAWILFRPYSGMDASSVALNAADWTLFFLAVVIGVGFALWSRYSLARVLLLVFVPAAAAAVYCLLFTSVLNVQGVVDAVLPGNSVLGAGDAGVPMNYVVALIMLLGTLAISVTIGVWWMGRVWLICAIIFYVIWAALYTTLFTNLAGLFTGSWQGMGYWIAQQDVARGNQPWYYYFVGLSVYELLPFAFGVAAIVYFARRQDVLGISLSLWAVLSLIAYTIATEKMPWLLVNITTPFILVAAKFLGELAANVDWRSLIRRGGELLPFALLVMAPVTVAAAVYLLLQYLDIARDFGVEHWLLLVSVVAAAFLGAYFYRLSGPGRAGPAVSLGLAVLLLAVGIWGSFRAAYTYDDSNVEVMAYAQGSADLQQTYRTLQDDVYPLNDGQETVKVDYDMWYPLQWYVRHHTRDGRMEFRCFETTEEDDSGCITLDGSQQDDGSYNFGNPAGLLVKDDHIGTDDLVRETYQRDGKFNNLLWFPETYRRPHENRTEEPMHTQLLNDFRFFGDTATSRQSWSDVLNYALFRRLDSSWYSSEYYSYLP